MVLEHHGIIMADVSMRRVKWPLPKWDMGHIWYLSCILSIVFIYTRTLIITVVLLTFDSVIYYYVC